MNWALEFQSLRAWNRTSLRYGAEYGSLFEALYWYYNRTKRSQSSYNWRIVNTLTMETFQP